MLIINYCAEVVFMFISKELLKLVRMPEAQNVNIMGIKSARRGRKRNRH